jgi:hypothetical protein
LLKLNIKTPAKSRVFFIEKELVNMGNQPVAKVKVGSVEVAVWENKSQNKLYWNSVTIQRHFKSGEKWKNTNSFRLRDIKDIITALEKVNEKMRVRFSGNFAGGETGEP